MSDLSNSFSRPALSGVVAGTGAVIRYSFYLVGALVFGGVGLWMLSTYSGRTHPVDDKPSFHVASSTLARIPAQTSIVTGSSFGRMEVLQHGSFYGREVSFSLALGFPVNGAGRNYSPQLNTLTPRNMRTDVSANYHDLDTRFGTLHAAEARLYNDGHWKQCLGFVSRFDSNVVFLTGWYCDGSGAKPNPSDLACIVDKLTLDRPLASNDADAYLRQRATRPASCGSAPVSQTMDTRTRSTISSPQRWSTPSASQRR